MIFRLGEVRRNKNSIDRSFGAAKPRTTSQPATMEVANGMDRPASASQADLDPAAARKRPRRLSKN
jgi:hypothetical protein